MAGFPHHQLESYLGKLIAAGFRAAVCEQVEDPKLAKGLVKREVTRVVTPGTITDDALLDPRESNYLAAVSPGDPVGLAWVEISTGRFVAAHFPAGPTGRSTGPDRARPNACWPKTPRRCRGTSTSRCWSRGGPAGPSRWKRPGRTCSSTFAPTTWKASASATIRATTRPSAAAGAVIDYLNETQKTSLEHVDQLAVLSQRHGPGDRRVEPPQPGDHAHHPRRPPRRLAAGRARPHRHRHGLAAAGRLAGQPADRRAGDPRPAGGRRRTGGRCGPGRSSARDLAEGLRRAAAAGPRDDRPGEPPRPELPRPHAARPCRA